MVIPCSYSALFNYVFEALNLLLIQLPGNGIRLLSRTQSSGQSSAMAGHSNVDPHHIDADPTFHPHADPDPDPSLKKELKPLKC